MKVSCIISRSVDLNFPAMFGLIHGCFDRRHCNTPRRCQKEKKKMGAYVERACGSPRCECGRRCCFRWRFTFKISVVSWFCSPFGPQTATFSFRSTHKSIAQIFRRRLERENADGIMNGTVSGVTGSVCRYDPGRWWVVGGGRASE